MSKKKPPGRKQSSDSSAVTEISNDAQWRSEVLEAEHPAIVDFWAPWCAPCRTMAPIFQQVAEAYEGSVRFFRVNTQLNLDLAQALNIRSIPTLVVFHRGRVFDVTIGVTPPDRLHKMVRAVLDKHHGVGLFQKLKRFWKRTESRAP
jgi:thioredoxin